MKTVPVQCRAHKGIFRVVKKPGRRPVSCDPIKNPCSQAGGQLSTTDKPELPKSRRDLRTRTLKPGAVTVRKVGAERKLAEKAGVVAAKRQPPAESIQQSESEYRARVNETYNAKYGQLGASPVNASLTPAMAAKGILAAQGWTVTGEAWFEEGFINRDMEGNENGDIRELGDVGFASVTAIRGDETIAIMWRDGEKVSQEYTIWDEKAVEGASKPNLRLSFNPDELSDVDLVRLIAGQKITWENSISGSEETAVVSPDTFRIDHRFVGSKLDENPGSRVINFLDHSRKSFRAIHVSALTNVESP